MLQPRRTLLLYLAILLLASSGLLLKYANCETEHKEEILSSENGMYKPSAVERVKRDAGDVTTVLLVDNTGRRHRDGRFYKKAVGLLTSEARTFVQEGTTTEFATQVLGTTLDNGRLYAQVVTTSSRVFYQGEPVGGKTRTSRLEELVFPSIPIVAADLGIRPTQSLESVRESVKIYPPQRKIEQFGYAKSGNIYQTAVNNLNNAPRSRYVGGGELITIPPSPEPTTTTEDVPNQEDIDELEALFLQAKARKQKYSARVSNDKKVSDEESENLVKAKRNEYFKKKDRELSENENEIRPSRVAVRPVDDLPTFTVRHEFSPSGFSGFEDSDSDTEDSTESKRQDLGTTRSSRFRSGKALFRSRQEQRKLDTVTYLGFSEFTTTVGDTVIVFMPHTSSSAPQGRKATSISGDATLAPDLHRSEELSVVTSVKTFMSHTPGMVTKTVTGHSLSMQTALPTTVVALPSSTTIHRDHKALQSASIESPHEPGFEHAAEYLAHEQQEMADKIPTTTPEIITEESIPETVEPSSVYYYEDVAVQPSSDLAEVVASSDISFVTPEVETINAQPTEPLTPSYYSTAQTQLFDTGGIENPLGLIKVVGGTEALNGTTTLFTSVVYGTIIDGNYAQVIDTTSSVFFFVDQTRVDVLPSQPTAVLDAPPTTSTPVPVSTTPEQQETIVTTEEAPPATTENSPTTLEQPTTEDDGSKTTKLDETLSTIPLEEQTTNPPITVDNVALNEVETGRKISSEPKEQIILESQEEVSLQSTAVTYVTQLVPTTAYKTFTYLTTFFIPAEGSLTTTSIRSREVTTSEVTFLTRLLTPEEAVRSALQSLQASSTADISVTSTVERLASSIAVATSVVDETPVTVQVATESNVIGVTNNVNQNEIVANTLTTPELPQDKATTEAAPPDTTIITTTPTSTTTENAVQGQEEEIELIFKTLYTTFTYFTTFFQESTSSVSTREEVITSVVTSTVDKSFFLEASDPAVAGLYNPNPEPQTPTIVPTSVGIGRPTTKFFTDDASLNANPDEDLFSSVIESVDLEKELASTATQALNELKTFYTTYTYFSTILVDGETTISTRTEIYTNIVTPSAVLPDNPSTPQLIEPTISIREPLFEKGYSESPIENIYEDLQPEILTEQEINSKISTPTLVSTPPNSYSSTILRRPSIETSEQIYENLISAIADDDENSIFPKNTQNGYATIDRSRSISPTPSSGEDETTLQFSSKLPREVSEGTLSSSPVSDSPVVIETMSTDVTSSTTSSEQGAGTQRRLMMLEKRNDQPVPLDDQASSESNTEELVNPSPTLLLQTSYTTFTYFTTMYKDGTSSTVKSRLETVTNVVTETLTPTAVPAVTIAPEDATLPITFFTTFTYWTTLYKAGTTTVQSREETVSNIITPSALSSTLSSGLSTIVITPTVALPTFTAKAEDTTGTTAETIIPYTESSKTPQLWEPTTYYTTYTYFTTSYIGNSTVLNSRLETVTNIVNGSTENDNATARAIGAATDQLIPNDPLKTNAPEILVSTPAVLQPTGLLSTILTSEINDGTTTLFSTDVFGTYIDGLYAKVLESSTQVITSTPTVKLPELKPTGVVSLNEGKIVDADGVSTTFYATKAVGTYIDSLYAEVVESTSSIYVNSERQSVLAAIGSTAPNESGKTFKTGLVRLIEGSIVKDQTTTFYESRVVGTLIDGRYAQIIESTSSFKVAVTPTSSATIAPSSTLDVSITPTVSVTTSSPSPAVIESSLSEGSSEVEQKEEDHEEGESEGEEEEDEENLSNTGKRVKSRLTFSSRKRTFTPVIRPFASRKRPTFNPTRKTAIGSSATTITRTTLTPTITATPAGKSETSRNRFGNRRGSSSALYRSSTDFRSSAGAGGRRSSRIRGSTTAVGASSTYGGRGRGSVGGSRIYATATAGPGASSRGRGGFYRSSTGRPGSSDYPGRSGSSARFRIRPTQSSLFLGRGASTAYTTPSPADETLEPDDDLTTIVTDETPQYTDDAEGNPTVPVSSTTESPRRSNNPLLRFRRPPTLRTPQTSTTTPRPSTTQSSRRSPLLRRPPANTTPRPRTTSKYNPVINRQRPGNSLFPPRGLLRKPGKEDQEEKKEEEEEEPEQFVEDEEDLEENEEELDDNDFEGSETKEAKAKPNSKKAQRRNGSSYNPVSIRPFVGFNRRRTKRQVAEYGSKNSRGFTPRYRRPGATRAATPEASEVQAEPEYTATTRGGSGRYTPRPRASQSAPRIRPTSASSNTGRSQFTLRKDDVTGTTTNTRSNFRRPSSNSRRRGNNKAADQTIATSTATRPKPPRLRTQSNTYTDTSATSTYSTSRANAQRRNPNSRSRSTSRSRYRSDTSSYGDTYTFSQSTFDGTITVTHQVPTEVTIPVVNGGVTEYRNVITASPSTEVLAPHQYTVSTRADGNTAFYLTSEVTGSLQPGGATEVTQFLIRETPTTSVIFTPTVIRGRKTSFSHIIPSTVYDVERVVSTVTPQIAPNAPLANILLSQLLLGGLGQPNINPLLALNNPGPPPSPTTEFKTRTTTYVTTVTKGKSTVIPITFRGKEILTTIADTSTEVITATEFITDTVVVTPTATGANQLNSLLLPALLQAQLLGQPQPQPMLSNPLLAGLQQQLLAQEQRPLLSDTSLDDTLLLLDDRRTGNERRRQKLSDVDDADRLARDSEKEILGEDDVQNVQKDDGDNFSPRQQIKSRKKIRNNDKKPPDPPPIPPPAETSLVTLYVSGRRPGEFSTVVSTVTLGDESSAAIKKREVGNFEDDLTIVPDVLILESSKLPEIGGSFPTTDDELYIDRYVMSAMNDVSSVEQNNDMETQSLESIVGDVSKYYVSGAINHSSSTTTAKPEISTPAVIENPASTEKNGKKKLNSKKKFATSSFNTTSATGHFLFEGPAESAPLTRKVTNNNTRGIFIVSYVDDRIDMNKEHYNHNHNDQQTKQRSKRESVSYSTEFGEAQLLKKRAQRRRRVRVSVPVNRQKSKEQSSEILSASEAQNSQMVHDMDITSGGFGDDGYLDSKDGRGSKVTPVPEFGSRRVKIIRGRGPAVITDSGKDGIDQPRRKVVVTRRKRPGTPLSLVPELEDAAVISGKIKDVEPAITTYHPSHHLVSSEFPYDAPENYEIEQQAFAPTAASSTSGRRRVVVTKKRPVSSPLIKASLVPSTQRRRIVVTKKRPIHKTLLVDEEKEIEEDVIEPSGVLSSTGSTSFSYKYSSIDRVKDKVSKTQYEETSLFTSSKLYDNGVPIYTETSKKERLENVEHEKISLFETSKSLDATMPKDENLYKELEVNNANAASVPELETEQEYDDTTAPQVETAKEDEEKEDKVLVKTSSVDESVNAAKVTATESQNDELSIPNLGTFEEEVKVSVETPSSKSTNLKEDVITHSPEISVTTEELLKDKPITILPSQIEPSFSSQERDTSEAGDVSTQHLVNLPTEDFELPPPITLTNEDQFIKIAETFSTLQTQETSIELEQSLVVTEETTKLSEITEPAITTEYEREETPSSVIEEESTTDDGPKFVRPTKFSITRRPGRTKTTFPGQRRRTSSTSVIPTSSFTPSRRSSSTRSYQKSSYGRGRRPSSSRAFGRSSKTRIYTTPSQSLFETDSSSIETSTESSILETDATYSSVPITSVTSTSSSLEVTPTLDSFLISSQSETSSSYLTTTETVTSTRLRTYTYIVTRVAGQEQVVTSTTEVKPHVTTLVVTKTLPVPAMTAAVEDEGRGLNLGEARYNLATKVMSNGVEVIVAGDKSTLPGEPEVLRILSSSLSRPITLAPSTLTDHMVLFLPQDSSQVEQQLSSAFVTKTYLTTYTYLTTFLREDRNTAVSSREKVVTNVVTEERQPAISTTPAPSATAPPLLMTSPTLAAGVFHTTYTYLNTLHDGDVPLVVTSRHTVSNTLTAQQGDFLLQPSREDQPTTNTYLSTVAFTKTLTEGADVKVVSTKDVVTQVVITESDQKATDVKSVSEDVATSAPVLPSRPSGSLTDVVKTYFVTYTYFSTFLEGGSTVVRSDVATSSDVVTEKVYVTAPKRTTSTPAPVATPPPVKEISTSAPVPISWPPLHVYATKTYLTTFTYFTTLLQDGGNGKGTSTVVSSRTRVVQNVVTESVDTGLLDPEYLESLRTSLQIMQKDTTSSSNIIATATLSGGQEIKITAMDHNIEPSTTEQVEVKPTASLHELSSSMQEDNSAVNNNVIKGSTIIFFDEDDQIDSSTASSSGTLAIEVAGHNTATPALETVQSTTVGGAEAAALTDSKVPTVVPISETQQGNPVFVIPSSRPAVTLSPVSFITSILATSTVTQSGNTLLPGDQVVMMTQPETGQVTVLPVKNGANNKKPTVIGPGGSEIQVSDLLSLGSLGINGLSALSPVFNAMAGLIQSNLAPDRRNDTTVIVLPQTRPTTTPRPYNPVYIPSQQVPPAEGEVRSPIYIPVGAAAGEDVDTAESQRYEGVAVNLNGDIKAWPLVADEDYPDTDQRNHGKRPDAETSGTMVVVGRPVEGALLGDGIPISPGEVITANSDVIVGKPAVMGPRPPKISGGKDDVPIGMKPPPPPPPPLWPHKTTDSHIPLREPLFPPRQPIRNHGGPVRDYHRPVAEGLPLLPPPMGHQKIPYHNTEPPVLVKIQPSQVASVIVPHDTELYEPYPLPESSPGFVAIDTDSQHHHVNQESHTRMDLPPPETEVGSHSSDNAVIPSQGINVEIPQGQGINVNVSPGQGINVEIGQLPPTQEQKISPSGIVLDAPLKDHISHHEMRPQYRPPPHRVPSKPHRPPGPHVHPHGHTFPHRPSDFMVPPPPPPPGSSNVFYHEKENGVHNGPVIIPLNHNLPQASSLEDLLIDVPNDNQHQDHHHKQHQYDDDSEDQSAEVDGDEVIQESKQRPVRPGQIPVETSNSASTHKPIIDGRPQVTSPHHDDALHQMKPPHHPLAPGGWPQKPSTHQNHRPIQVFVSPPHTLPNKPHHPDTHGKKPHNDGDIILATSMIAQKPKPGPHIEEIPAYSKPEIIVESRPHYPNQVKPTGSTINVGHEYVIHNTQKLPPKPDEKPYRPPDQPSRADFNHSIPSGGNRQELDKFDDLYHLGNRPQSGSSEPPLLYDLETQANTPRPFASLPHPSKPGTVVLPPPPDFKTDESVVGLTPPPPVRVAPGSSNGQRLPMAGIEPHVSTHRPTVVNIGGNANRRPPNRNKPRPIPPYKFEIPTTIPTTTSEAPTTQKPSSETKRPFWIRPSVQEISGPKKPASGTEENTVVQNIPPSPPHVDQSHRRPVTTWRPPLSPERPRPVVGLPSKKPFEDHHKPLSSPEDNDDQDTMLQTVVIGKPIPEEPVISPTAPVEDNVRRPSSSLDIITAGVPWNEDVVVGSEIPVLEPGSTFVATPSISTKTSDAHLGTSTVAVSSGSKTIFGNLFTKPSVVHPSRASDHYDTTSRLSIGGHKNNQYGSIQEDEDEEDLDDGEYENDGKNKYDLGVAATSNKNVGAIDIRVPEPASTRYVTQTLTVTLTETTVVSSLGQQPSTRTIIVTKTQISTHLDTVTETKVHTLVRPTSIVATVTTTVSAPPKTVPPYNYHDYSTKKPEEVLKVEETKDEVLGIELVPEQDINKEKEKVDMDKKHKLNSTQENTRTPEDVTGEDENEMFFIVVNDKKPVPSLDEDVAQGNAENEDGAAVLLGGVLLPPPAPPHYNIPSTSNQCHPECSPARNELCQRVQGHMRCVCRPGFARMFPDRPCRPTYTYMMTMGLSNNDREILHYDGTLEDVNSQQFHQLSKSTKEGLDRMVMQSDLRDIYHGVVVKDFQPAPGKEDGVMVNFYVQLSENADEERLQDVFKKSLRTSNFSLGGTQMYADRTLMHQIRADDFDECQSPKFHDCSEHAQCFNLRGTYTCSCRDGYADLSENPLFPGRVCSAEMIGCEKCNYHGTCYPKGDDLVVCECFQWYAGENCQINLKVLLIALVTIGAVLLALLVVCVVLTCLKRSNASSQQPRSSGFLRYRSPTHTLDKRAMIQDSSSEGSVAAEHAPISYLTPTHQPASTFGTQIKQVPLAPPGGRKVSGLETSDEGGHSYSEQRDRSLTVMIPRAKYRPIPPTSPMLSMSTFGAEQKRAIAQEQQKLLSYLDNGNSNKQQEHRTANNKRKQSASANQTTEAAQPQAARKSSAPRKPSTGALVSAGFEVSATVGRKEPDSDTDVASAAVVKGDVTNGGHRHHHHHHHHHHHNNTNTLASNGSHFTTLRTNDSEDKDSTLPAESPAGTENKSDENSRVQELTVSEARSFDETTVQPPTKSLHSNYGSNPSSRNPNDEAHTMAERDLGSTLLMPQTHLYKPDRGSDISNFDSL